MYVLSELSFRGHATSGVGVDSCTSSTGACRGPDCGWTWTTSPPPLLLLLCFTDKVIIYQYLSLWFLQTLFLFNPFKWSFLTPLYCVFRGGLGPIHATQNRMKILGFEFIKKPTELKMNWTQPWSGLNANGFTANGNSSFFSCTVN